MSENFRNLQNKLNRIVITKLANDENLYKYNLEMLRYLIVCNLMSAWGKGGFLRITGSAEALSNMLIGFEELDINKILVDFEHPEFRNRSSLALNTQNYATGMYYIASTSLYNISKKEIEKWSLKALKGNQVMLNLIDKLWDLPKLREIEEKRGLNMTNNIIAAILGIFNAMIKYLILLYPRLTSLDSSIFSEIELISFKDHKSFLISIEKLVKLSLEYIKDIRNQKKNRIFDPNDDPLDNLTIKSNIEYLYLWNNLVQGLKLINTKMKLDENFEKPLEKTLNRIKKNLQTINSYFSDTKILLNRYGEILEGFLRHYLSILAYKALRNNDMTLLTEFKELSTQYFTESGIERFPRLYYLFLTAKVALGCENTDNASLKELSKELLSNIEYLILQPRDEWSFSLLGYLIKIVTREIGKKEFFEEIEKVKNKIENLTDESFRKEIISYLGYLKKSSNGTPPNFLLKRIFNPNPLDPYSFIIPDFKKYSDKLNYQKLIYIPFNLEKDAVS